LTTSHMRRTLARENFTSGRRRRAISLSMLKVPIVMSIIIELFFKSQVDLHETEILKKALLIILGL